MSDFACTLAVRDLVSILGRAVTFVDKSPLAVLKAVLLDARDAELVGQATDTIRSMDQRVDATVAKAGRIAVNADRFYAVAKELPAGNVTLTLKDSQLEVRAGKAKIRVPVIAADDFPTLPAVDGATLHAKLDAREVLRALAQGAYAAGEHELAPQLAGCQLEFLVSDDGAELLVVSTDRQRLAVSSIKCDCKPGKMLLPAKGVGELRRIAESDRGGQVEVRGDGVHAFFMGDRITVSVKLIDLQFPPWRKLLPDVTAHTVTVAREMLSSVARRIAAVSEREDGGAIQVSFGEGVVRVSGSSADYGDGEDFLDSTCTGKEPTLLLSPRHLVAALDAMTDDDVAIDIASDSGPLVLHGTRSSECRALLMPRRAV